MTQKREFTLKDVTMHDARLLMAASGQPEKSWFCFGRAWYKLDILELLDDDLKPTPLGMALARKLLEDR